MGRWLVGVKSGGERTLVAPEFNPQTLIVPRVVYLTPTGFVVAVGTATRKRQLQPLGMKLRRDHQAPAYEPSLLVDCVLAGMVHPTWICRW